MEFQIENNTESELAEEKVREALNRSAEALPKEDDLEVVIDYSDFDFIKEKMNGVMGMPRGSSKIEMSFHPESSNWPEFLASMTCHEFAHTFYSEKWGERYVDFEWRAILQEAQSQNFAEKMYPQTDAPMREHLTKKEVSEYWPEIKEDWLDQRFESTDDELFFGTGEMPLWLGYSLAYYTGQKLLQQGYTLEEFPELEKEDVINAGDKLFD